MTVLRRISWRVVGGGCVFAATLVLCRLLLQVLGFGLERAPAQAPEEIAGYYLLGGSIGLATGTIWVVKGLGASPLRRWSVASAFVVVGFALSTTIEAGIYSASDGSVLTVLLLLPPCLALVMVQVIVFPVDVDPSPEGPETPARGVARREWAWRLAAAVFSFPAIYLVFGIIVSPIVMSYYAEGAAGLVLPSTGLIVGTQVLRGILHVAIVLLVMRTWCRSRRQLVMALTAAFFVFVMMYDVVLAYEVPVVLIATHSVEVLADSFVFSWIATGLLAPMALDMNSRLAIAS